MFPSTLVYSRRGNANIWTDSHVSKAMLSAHLDPDSDGASRKPHIISKTIDWVAEQCKGAKRILDLGCGPGLYSTKLAAKGFSVTGLDINPVSIEYARRVPERAIFGSTMNAETISLILLKVCMTRLSASIATSVLSCRVNK